MIKNAPLKYAVTFYIEAINYEALEAAVEYVAKRLEIGKVVYTRGPYTCVCRVELKWGGGWLAVKTCTERAVAKLLVTAYTWFGGKTIQVVRL